MAWLAQYMESHGIEVDLRDHCGHSPLHLAARAGHASAVAILVAHGADVTAKVFIFCFHFYFIRHEDKHIFYFTSSFPISHPPKNSCRLSFPFFSNFIQLFKTVDLFIYSLSSFLTISLFFYILAAAEWVGSVRHVKFIYFIFFPKILICYGRLDFIQSYTQRPLSNAKAHGTALSWQPSFWGITRN